MKVTDIFINLYKKADKQLTECWDERIKQSGKFGTVIGRLKGLRTELEKEVRLFTDKELAERITKTLGELESE